MSEIIKHRLPQPPFLPIIVEKENQMPIFLPFLNSLILRYTQTHTTSTRTPTQY